MVPAAVGLPILFEADLSPNELRHMHYGEVALQNDVLVTMERATTPWS
jgi:hypothetical protein